jgi:hypothetical protein
LTKYRTRTVEVDAIQWDGTDAAKTAIEALCGGKFEVLDPEDRAHCDDPEATASILSSEHSTWETVLTGAWIIVRGTRHISQLSAEQFTAGYEPAIHPGGFVAAPPHAADQHIVEAVIRQFRFSGFGFDEVDIGLADYPDEQQWVASLAAKITVALTSPHALAAGECVTPAAAGDSR